MDEELKKIFPGDLLELLANVAFVGIERGRFKEAQEIFSALVDVRPHNINSKIAQAMGELMMCNVKDANKMLMACLKEDPNNETVKGFLAIALKMGQADDQAVSLSKHILKNCKNNDTRSIAQGILETCKNALSLHKLQAEQCQKVAN